MNDGVGPDDGPTEDTEAADEFLQGQEGKAWLTFSSNNVSYLLILVIYAIFFFVFLLFNTFVLFLTKIMTNDIHSGNNDEDCNENAGNAHDEDDDDDNEPGDDE